MTDRRRQVPAWPRGPERLRPAPQHPGFAQYIDVCRLCRALVPATDLARARHQEHDAKIVAAETAALANQLSGVGSSSPPGDPGSSPAPATDAPTPTSGEAGHAGVAGANQSKPKPAASEAPDSPDGTRAPAGPTASLGGSSGATKRPGRGQRDGLGSLSPAPAVPFPPDEIEQAKLERDWAAEGWLK